MICGTSSAASADARPRGRPRSAVACAVAVSVLVCGVGQATAGSLSRSQKPRPQTLWRSYPLDDAHRGRPPAAKLRSPAPKEARRGGSDAASGDTWLLAVLAAAGVVAVTAIAAFALRQRGVVPVMPTGTVVGLARAAGRRMHRYKGEGERIMANQKRKLWDRIKAEGGLEQPQPQQQPSDGHRSTARESEPARRPAEAAEAATPSDLGDVGAEVGTVLKSAQEAAARIRQQARAEAIAIRGEAKTAAEAELAEARRIAEAGRSDVRRIRKEAEADAQATRAEAETFAQQVRTSAEREADELLKKARERLAHADAEVEKRLRRAELDARRRRDALQAESKLYEERLHKMLGVFQGMGSQLEELIGPRQEAEGPDRDRLEEALQPDTASLRET
jgi:hypothetical protein